MAVVENGVPDVLTLEVGPMGELAGRSSSPKPPASVTARLDGARWATIPCAASGSGWAFQCDLPPAPSQGDRTGQLELTDPAGRVLARRQVAYAERRNAAGLGASAILPLHDTPFFAVPYFSFDGALLTVLGSHLPPGGDPSALSVEVGGGVVHHLEHSLPSPDWGSHFWYWPNAGFSGFRMIVDVAASAPGSDPFTFRFTHTNRAGERPAEPHGRVWIPRDMGVGQGLPADPTQLTRVQTWSTHQSAIVTGYNAFRTIAELLAAYGIGSEGTRLMDWGCGHGRVTRHFAREWPRAIVTGMDIDGENIAWASQHIARARFVASPLLPPCPLEDGCLDALFSISVMTHLSEETQLRWLDELARLLRPGGVALMSFGGPSAVAWSSIWHTPDFVAEWSRTGFDARQVDRALAGKITDPEYYRVTAQTHEHVRRCWTACFDLLEILPEAIGNLDIAVLRRR